jgi:hypothetical protein
MSALTWSIFDGWTLSPLTPEPLPSWEAVVHLGKLASATLYKRSEFRANLVDAYDERLRDLGGEVMRQNWSAFRPLRLSREEDWSDWLAFLLQSSSTGELASQLFRDVGELDAAPLAHPDVGREEQTANGGRRADLLIRWRDGGTSHVEVKIWDQAFEKTFDTAAALRTEYAVNEWRGDFILLPEESMDAWAVSAESMAPTFGFSVQAITWRRVAISLRRCLWARREPLTWLAWAYALCGSIEQFILQHPRFESPSGVATLSVDFAVLPAQPG